MEEKSLKQLQAELVALGMPEEDVKAFRSKTMVQNTINTLTAVKAEPAEEKEIKKVKSIIERPNPREEKTVIRKYKTKREIMRAKLEAQPTVRFFLPLSGQEQAGVVREVVKNGRKEQIYVSGAIETVQLNGYKILIPKGNFIDIPQQVAEVLSDSMQLTNKAGEAFLIDRVNPETGQSVRSRLE